MGMQVCDDVAFRAAMADISTPLVIDLMAPWCDYCNKMDPHITRLAEEREGSIRFVKVDNDEHPEVGLELAPKTLPLVVLMKDGKEIDRRGSGDYDQLTAWLAEHGL